MGEVLCSMGQMVEPHHEIAKSELVPGSPYVLDLKAELKIRPDEISSVMLKSEAEHVKAGETVARLKTRHGVKEVKAQVDGVIEFVSVAYGRVLIREAVKPDHPVVTLEVTKKMGVPPWQIRFYSRVKEGDEVRQGTILASESVGSFSGLIHSPVTGVVEKICGRTGTITVRRPYRPTYVHAYIPGKIVHIEPGFGADVLGTGFKFEGVLGIGGEVFGRCRVACGPDETFDETLITADDKGKVLLGGALVTEDAIRKALENGVKAIVSGGIDIESLESFGIGVRGITGAETLGITLLVMHGFGAQPLDSDIVEAALSFDGVASATGATQMRAGVKRPELLLCDPKFADAAEEEQRPVPVIRPGARARVLMGAYQGRPVEVVETLPGTKLLETGELVEVCTVNLPDGRKATVPRANLRIVP